MQYHFYKYAKDTGNLWLLNQRKYQIFSILFPILFLVSVLPHFPLHIELLSLYLHLLSFLFWQLPVCLQESRFYPQYMNCYCSLTSLTLAVKLCAKNVEQPRIQPINSPCLSLKIMVQ